MAYWLASRAANLVRVLRERWREQYAPALATRWGALTSHARDLLTRSEPTAAQPYSSLSVAVREAQRESRYRESRYRGNASGISATT